jgi:hypothetical protein
MLGLGNGCVKKTVTATTNTRSNRRIVGRVVFCAVRIVSRKIGDSSQNFLFYLQRGCGLIHLDSGTGIKIIRLCQYDVSLCEFSGVVEFSNLRRFMYIGVDSVYTSTMLHVIDMTVPF